MDLVTTPFPIKTPLGEFTAVLEFDSDCDHFFATVTIEPGRSGLAGKAIREGYITFAGRDPDELRAHFAQVLDHHLAL